MAPSRAPGRTTTLSPTLESSDSSLAAALLAVAAAPMPATHRRVAEEYRRRGVLDAAETHYQQALALDDRDIGALDGLARIWRDWGLASRGLAFAHRAAHFAPDSAAAANTLGTLLQATGQVRLARQWYKRAIALDPRAGYARSNLCYALIVMQEPDALAECRAAVAASPTSAVAHNNLGLAYAAAGDLRRAEQEFHRLGDTSAARYNLGIVQMAVRDYRGAARAFASALQASPEFTMAARRAKQAREAAETEEAQ